MELSCKNSWAAAVAWLWQRKDVREDKRAAVRALAHAASSGCADSLRILLSKPSPLNLNDTGEGVGLRTALPAIFLAAEGAHLEAVLVLLAAGASVRNAQNSRWGSVTALLHACAKPDFESRRARIVQLILDADKGVINFRSGLNETPLHAAARVGLALCCQILIDAGAE